LQQQHDDEINNAMQEQSDNKSLSSDEAALKRTKVVKNTKHESKVVKKESPKSTSICKKERGAKGKKNCKEDDNQYIDEIELTGSRKSVEVYQEGSRKLVEVYQEDVDDNLTDNAGHKSLEKERNCTVIQKANAALMVKFGKAKVGTGHLQNIYSKEKSDDSITTASHLNILTSYTR
jgi:hypothetical protein